MVLESLTCMKLIEIANLIYLFYHFGKPASSAGNIRNDRLLLESETLQPLRFPYVFMYSARYSKKFTCR